MSLDRSVMPVRVRDEAGNYVTIAQDAAGNRRFYVEALTTNEALADDGKVFLAIIDSINLGTGTDEKDIFLLKNPAASGVAIQLKQIIVSTVKTSGGTNLRYYRAPTITANGTALTIQNKRNDGVTGEGDAYSLPTITARGNKLGVFGIAGSGQVIIREDYELYLDENENFLVTLEQPSSNQTYSITLVWAEIPTA